MLEPEHVTSARAVYDHSADLYMIDAAQFAHSRLRFDVGPLAAAGFEVSVDLRRDAELEHETTPQAFLIAQRSDRSRTTSP